MKPGLAVSAARLIILLAGAIAGILLSACGSTTTQTHAQTESQTHTQTTPKIQAKPAGVAGNWHLIFDDEFNGTSLDQNVWNANWYGSSAHEASDGLGHEDLSCDSPQAVRESGGDLLLAVEHKTCAVNHGATYRWTGTLINTHNNFSFTYGFLQARIWVPTSHGKLINSLSFWADGTGTWPYTGELDVVEILPCGGRTRFGFHFHNPQGMTGHCVNVRHPGGWHTFGADWSRGSVSYYYDGRRVGTLTRGITGAPMYLVLSQSVDPAKASRDIKPAVAKVDYVRVWEPLSDAAAPRRESTGALAPSEQ